MVFRDRGRRYCAQPPRASKGIAHAPRLSREEEQVDGMGREGEGEEDIVSRNKQSRRLYI